MEDITLLPHIIKWDTYPLGDPLKEEVSSELTSEESWMLDWYRPHNFKSAGTRALSKYIGSGYGPINAAARRNLLMGASQKNQAVGGLAVDVQLMTPLGPWTYERGGATEEDFTALARRLNSLCNANSLPLDLYLYRGVSDIPFISDKHGKFDSGFYDQTLLPGEIVTFPGFLSTTLSPSFAVAVATVGVQLAAAFVADSHKAGIREKKSDGILLQFEYPARSPYVYTNDIGEYEVVIPPLHREPNKQLQWIVTKRHTIKTPVMDRETEMIPKFRRFKRNKLRLLKPKPERTHVVYVTIDCITLRPYGTRSIGAISRVAFF